MRLRRIVAVLGLVAALSLPAAASAAESKRHIGLHDMTCTSIVAMGKGLAPNATLQLTLSNRDNGTTLAGQTVRTSAKGEFMAKLPARLNKVLSIRLTVSRPDGSKVAFADHVMAKGAPMCDLPFTGPSRTTALLLTGSVAVALGLVLLVADRRLRTGLGRVHQAHGPRPDPRPGPLGPRLPAAAPRPARGRQGPAGRA